MKHVTKTVAMLLLAGVALLSSCKKDAKIPEDQVSQAVKDQISAMGFTSSNVQKIDEGYLVEGDIIITPELLNSTPQTQFLRVGQEEQYRTINLVHPLPRVITV